DAGCGIDFDSRGLFVNPFTFIKSVYPQEQVTSKLGVMVASREHKDSQLALSSFYRMTACTSGHPKQRHRQE
ncbi:hypothetical protein NM22_13495, partial [Vibrio tubiashii]